MCRNISAFKWHCVNCVNFDFFLFSKWGESQHYHVITLALKSWIFVLGLNKLLDLEQVKSHLSSLFRFFKGAYAHAQNVKCWFLCIFTHCLSYMCEIRENSYLPSKILCIFGFETSVLHIRFICELHFWSFPNICASAWGTKSIFGHFYLFF